MTIALRCIYAVSSLLLVAVGSAAQAAPLSNLSQGQSGLIEYSSIWPTGIYPLVTKAASPAITITGTLTFPAAVSGKVPAMVLAHHCNGITASVTNLAALLNGIGIATFIPDSFTPRGVTSVCSGSSTVSHAAATADALYALKLLATHPSIDASRIGIIGQSFGGNTVYNTAFEEVRKSIISDSLKFATHIGIYPGCEIRNWSPNMTGAPILILTGGADDWAPAANCADYSLVLRAQGPQITTIIYPDAPHAWDNPTGSVNYDPNRGNYANCRFQYRLDTLQSSRYDTGAVLGGTATTDYINSCFKRGASQGRNDATKIASDRDIAIFLANIFKLANVATPASQPDRIFNYAESNYSSFFAPAGAASQTTGDYYFRYYSTTNSYIATSGGKLYYYAPAVHSSIPPPLGDEATFLNMASQAGY